MLTLSLRETLLGLQFGFDSSTQNPSVLIGFGLTTAVVVSQPTLSLLSLYTSV